MKKWNDVLCRYGVTPRLREKETGFALLVMLLFLMITMSVFLLFVVKRSAITSRFSMKDRYEQDVNALAKDPLVDAMAYFNGDWRQDFFDVGVPLGLGGANRIGSLFNMSINLRTEKFPNTGLTKGRESNTYRLRSFSATLPGVNIKDPLFNSKANLDAVVSFRQDAPRFEWVFPGNVNLDNLPPFLRTTPINRTVYVNGDLNMGSQQIAGFWVVNGTVTCPTVGAISSQGEVRCRRFVPTAPPAQVRVSGINQPEPGVYVFDPLINPAGVDYYATNASTIVAGGPTDTVTVDFTADWRTPAISINAGTPVPYPLSIDRNVIVVRGAGNVVVVGNNTQISYPLVIVALRDPVGGAGGNMTVQGNFNQYSNVEPAFNVGGARSGAFSFMFRVDGDAANITDIDVSLAMMAQGNLTLGAPATPQQLMGLYYAGGTVLLNPTSTVSVTGTVYGFFNPTSTATSLTVTADPGLSVYAPRFVSRRPGIVSILSVPN